MKTDSIEVALEDVGTRSLARVEIRWSGKGGVRTALRLLTRVVLDVVVRARGVDGTHPPAQVGNREAEGTRWNG